MPNPPCPQNKIRLANGTCAACGTVTPEGVPTTMVGDICQAVCPAGQFSWRNRYFGWPTCEDNCPSGYTFDQMIGGCYMPEQLEVNKTTETPPDTTSKFPWVGLLVGGGLIGAMALYTSSKPRGY